MLGLQHKRTHHEEEVHVSKISSISVFTTKTMRQGMIADFCFHCWCAFCLLRLVFLSRHHRDCNRIPGEVWDLLITLPHTFPKSPSRGRLYGRVGSCCTKLVGCAHRPRLGTKWMACTTTIPIISTICRTRVPWERRMTMGFG